MASKAADLTLDWRREGKNPILGFGLADAEDTVCWKALLMEPKARGLLPFAQVALQVARTVLPFE